MQDNNRMTKDTSPSISTQDIKDWLGNNPDFLQKNPDIIDLLLPPRDKEHEKTKGVIDFQYYMVERLKQDRDLVLESTKEMVATSRANMNNLSRIHSAVLMLLEARNFEDFLRDIDC